MTRFWVVLCVFLAVTFSASAQDDPWPESVAPAYTAYETAMAERDFVAAHEAAETAWRAGQATRLEPARRGVLAENFARLALAFRQYDNAYEAWRDAAEMSDRARAPAPERAVRWYGASLAAYARGNLVEARQCSQNASRVEARADAPLASQLSGDIHYMIAMSNSELGHVREAGTDARLALAAFEASGRAFDQRYANAYYLSGLNSFLFGEKFDSALDFHYAQHIFSTLEGPDSQTAALRARMWLRMAEGRLSDDQLEQVGERIAASALPEAETYPSIDRDGLRELEAEPLNPSPLTYPTSAERQGIEGAVLLQYIVNEAGRVEDVEVIASMPVGVFDAACIESIEARIYEPLLEDGVPIRRWGETDVTFLMAPPGTRRPRE